MEEYIRLAKIPISAIQLMSLNCLIKIGTSLNALNKPIFVSGILA